uniref:Peptidase S1 domain-containing protein n=1 Tax=Steinernema glaseri TaxID=37863 RepID=A0A1I8AJQ7_9BILA
MSSFLNGVLLLGSLALASSQDYPNFEPKIIGGQKVPPGKHPYFASLANRSGRFCGGSIIGTHFILTAAHCIRTPFYNFTKATHKSLFHVRVGQGTSMERRYKIANYAIAVGFNGTSLDDIAIIETEKRIVFNKAVHPICLPLRSLQEGDEATAMGYGRINAKDYYSAPSTLMELTGTVRPGKECEDEEPHKHPEELMCFGSPTGNVCNGDSGGPVVSGHFQYGIASSTYFGCPRGKPGTFTRVSTYCDQIYRATQGRVQCRASYEC